MHGDGRRQLRRGGYLSPSELFMPEVLMAVDLDGAVGRTGRAVVGRGARPIEFRYGVAISSERDGNGIEQLRFGSMKQPQEE